MTLLVSNESKNRICRIYNEISKELFGFGTTILRTTVENNIVTFVAKHRRSSRRRHWKWKPPA